MQKTMIYLAPEMHERLRYMALDEKVSMAELIRRAVTDYLKRSPEKAGREMRGDGCIYPRGNMLWIAYSFRGKMFRESAHTTDEKVARKVLRRLKQVERRVSSDPKRTGGRLPT